MKTGSVFCDLQKAFDTVNHKLLLDKLQYYGIEGKTKILLESYLQNRYQTPPPSGATYLPPLTTICKFCNPNASV